MKLKNRDCLNCVQCGRCCLGLSDHDIINNWDVAVWILLSQYHILEHIYVSGIKGPWAKNLKPDTHDWHKPDWRKFLNSDTNKYEKQCIKFIPIEFEHPYIEIRPYGGKIKRKDTFVCPFIRKKEYNQFICNINTYKPIFCYNWPFAPLEMAYDKKLILEAKKLLKMKDMVPEYL